MKHASVEREGRKDNQQGEVILSRCDCLNKGGGGTDHHADRKRIVRDFKRRESHSIRAREHEIERSKGASLCWKYYFWGPMLHPRTSTRQYLIHESDR